MCIRDSRSPDASPVLTRSLRFEDRADGSIAVIDGKSGAETVSYTHLRAHETPEHLVCRLLLEKKKKQNKLHRENLDPKVIKEDTSRTHTPQTTPVSN